MKGALGLIAVAVIVWVFWMSYEHLRKPRENKSKTRKRRRV